MSAKNTPEQVSQCKAVRAAILALAPWIVSSDNDPKGESKVLADPTDVAALFQRCGFVVRRAALDEYRPKVEAIIASKVQAHPAYMTSTMLANPDLPASMRPTVQAMHAANLSDEEKRTIAVSDFQGAFGEGCTLDTAAERLSAMGYEVHGKQSAKRIKLPATAYEYRAPVETGKVRKSA
jgi:hypothetical protein